ncbi:MAG TPA: UBP-type zinc finger domain-containing protein [Casimicrobiaceae bacterium]
MPERCEHFAGLGPVEPRTKGCEECLAIGSKWTELRVCLTCGHVGCCEDSKHAHALQHFKSTRHPIIVPLEHSETWAWCYVDRRYFDYARATPPGKRSALATLLGRLIGR